jgi:hypothetical protein
MLPAIHFDDEHPLKADEVRHERPNRVLKPKLAVEKLSIAQP